MLLTYSRNYFVPAIKAVTKIHTLRADPTKRWKAGVKIQYRLGNARNIRSKVKPHHFADGECKGIQDVTICQNAEGIPTVYVFPKKGELSDEYLPMRKFKN